MTSLQDLKTHVGGRIKMLREKKGLSQEDLAKPFKSQRSYICDVEAGRKNVTLETLHKIAEVLGVEVSVFFVW